tara:strand:- start:259 stop:603 length:345 start_codon:yes stop_codon:yes gene_type:complete
MRIFKIILILLILIVSLEASAKKVEIGDVVTARYVCKTPYFLVQFENAVDDKEVMEIYDRSIKAGTCSFLSKLYIFTLKNKVHEYAGVGGFSQIWGTDQGAYIIISESEEEFKV